MLLPTKLFPPPTSMHLVDRSRLERRLTDGLARPLTLVSAPAGFGKSTLLAEWAAALQHTGQYRQAWLSLDPQDNDPAQFWAYLFAAWKSALPAEGPLPADLLEQVQTLLQGNEAAIAERIAGTLIQLWLAVPVPVLIVLDDYHQIHHPEIHTEMAQVIERLPAHIRLAVAARSDPPLPVPRLRVREQVTEIRAADLRFTGEEIAQLFQKIPGVHFTPADIAVIEASTEGWAAGLKMAVLALQAQECSAEETRQFWSSFTGRNVYVLDYLTEEVLGHLPAETQAFLMKTAILERFNDALCSAVVFDGERLPSARAILGQLEQANLFLIPLDQERCWFRYHHLFADLLRVRLQQQFGEETAELHRKAARWFEQAGWIEDAVQHSMAAEDWECSARLVEAHSHAYLDRGQLATVLKWVEALPAGLLRQRPNLCIQMAWALGHAGKTQLVGPLLKDAEAALNDWEQQQGQPVASRVQMTQTDAVRIRASVAFFRAYGSILAARPGPALQLAEQALGSAPDLETRERAWLNWVAGYACRGLGDIDAAIGYFAKAVKISREDGAVWEDLSTDLGIAYRLRGRLEDAAAVFEEALQAGTQSGLRNKGNLSRVEAYLSAVRMEQNRVEEALAHARTAVDYLRWWPSHNHIATAHGFTGLALLATGALAEARESIERADLEHRKGEVTPFVVQLVATARVRLWLAAGDQAALNSWAAAQSFEMPDDPAANPFNEYEAMRLIALARAWIGLGRWEKNPAWFQKAAQMLRVLSISARARQQIHAGIEIDMLAALAHWELAKAGQGSTLEALDWLTRSLAQGAAGGYRRIYIDEGATMRALLAEWLSRDRRWLEAGGVDVDAVRRLFADAGQPAVDVPEAALFEPLTEREKDVLHLLALGLSNRELAEKLVVSEGTIKSHVHNLIAKLGAQSRTQVLARARELKLLS